MGAGVMVGLGVDGWGRVRSRWGVKAGACLVGLQLVTSVWAADQTNPQPNLKPSPSTEVSADQPTLSLRQLLLAAQAYHPSLTALRLQTEAAGLDVTAIERQRWPTVSILAEKDANAVPGSNGSALRIEQTIWDAGRINARVTEANRRVGLAQAQTQMSEQDIYFQVVAAWQSLLGGLERRRAADEALSALQGYQAQMLRRVAAETSPQIDLELVASRLLQTEVERTTADASVSVALSRLQLLTGLEQLPVLAEAMPPLPDSRTAQGLIQIVKQADLRKLAQQQPSVAKAQLDRRLLDDQIKTKEAELWPQVYARVDQPLTAGGVNRSRAPSYHLGVRQTLGAGLSSLVEVQALAKRAEGQTEAVSAAVHEVMQSLLTDRDELYAATTRMAALERSVEGSRQVVASYARQFQAGRKSWIDLLNAARELAQSQYSLADARAGWAGAWHRLQLRLGV